MATRSEQRAEYQALQAAGKLHGSVARAMRRQDLDRTHRAVRRVVPLGGEIEAEYIRRAQGEYPRFREWSGGVQAVAVVSDMRRGWCIWESGDKGGSHRRSTFRRGVYVMSVASCEDFRLAILWLGPDKWHIPAPRGYRWDADLIGGVLLRGRAGSYHPTASELVAATRDRGRGLVAALKAAAAARKEQERLAKVAAREAAARKEQEDEILRRAEHEGCMVCLLDSLRAGNCAAGTRSWASAHGLDSRQHYSPSQVLALANGQRQRVALVVAVALRRHRTEMERGYSLVIEHRVER